MDEQFEADGKLFRLDKVKLIPCERQSPEPCKLCRDLMSSASRAEPEFHPRRRANGDHHEAGRKGCVRRRLRQSRRQDRADSGSTQSPTLRAQSDKCAARHQVPGTTLRAPYGARRSKQVPVSDSRSATKRTSAVALRRQQQPQQDAGSRDLWHADATPGALHPCVYFPPVDDVKLSACGCHIHKA